MNRSRSIFLSTLFLAAATMLAPANANAQIRLPRPSPKASIAQAVGVTDVTITYSRPAVKGRTIWGDAPADAYAKGEATLDDSYKRPKGMPIVPYGHIWRAGANEATQFTVTDDVLINGQKLVAGSYSLHAIPAKDEWTIVFNGNANQWGSFFYDPKKDTLRVKTKALPTSDNQEWLSYSIEPATENSAVVHLRWEKVRVPFTIEIPDLPALTYAKAKQSVEAAKADDFRTPYSAALLAKERKITADSTAWFERSLRSVDTALAAKETFPALAARANILRELGRTDELIAALEKAIASGKAEKADTSALEKRLADLKDAKK